MAAATMYVTVAGAGTKNGLSWANAFGLAEFETDAEGAAEAGDIYYVLSGTYDTSGFDFSTVGRDATVTAVIRVIGVSDEALTPATGDDRPLFERGTRQLRFGKYWQIENCRSNGTSGIAWYVEQGGLFRSCKGYSSTGDGFYVSTDGKVIDCEAETPNGEAFRLWAQARAVGCNAHDSDYGFVCESHDVVTEDCLADTCATAGINCGSFDNHVFSGLTIYNCGTGILATDANSLLVKNCIIASCIVGAEWTTEQESNIFDYIDWYGNGTDTVNVTKGSNAMALDPEFVDAPNGDFRVGQRLAGMGFPRLFPGGLTRSYLDVGAVQRVGLAIVSAWFSLVGSRG